MGFLKKFGDLQILSNEGLYGKIIKKVFNCRCRCSIIIFADNTFYFCNHRNGSTECFPNRATNVVEMFEKHGNSDYFMNLMFEDHYENNFQLTKCAKYFLDEKILSIMDLNCAIIYYLTDLNNDLRRGDMLEDDIEDEMDIMCDANGNTTLEENTSSVN